MLRYIQLLLILLTCQLPQFRRTELRLPDEISREFHRKRARRRKPKNRDHVPRRSPPKVHPKYRGTKPLDHRYSDHQRLRRMYRKY